ncbi:hypothetical protein DFR49_2274 [Hephaestia caeni]|uniref:Uncharacterized protein n=1 Tax=Hephaestia caeni TaxID=645617 RepID=A0A397P569_9SPHN|nr:hypothetical protein [Hephaestia caeni]RIA44038.1 hypothetical protein DFR49_2274 [Hephaestia caeni]
MSVDALFAEWLQADALFKIVEDAGRLDRWGDSAMTVERASALASKEAAANEGERQLIFFGGPLATEEHLLPGEWRHRRGQVITVTIDRLGYEEGMDVFVLFAQDDLATGLSTVTVLRRL